MSNDFAPGVVTRYSAFTDTPAGGNPAGVVLDASGLSAERMLAIAAEVGYSETAFLTPRSGSPAATREYDVRYFSLEAEVTFCGHATIAAAVALAERDGATELIFHTLAGEVPVTTRRDSDGRLSATLTSFAPEVLPADAADVQSALMLERDLTTVDLVWREDDITFHARNPFPVGGVVEDPATGVAAAAFGGYLRALGAVTPPATITIHQGHDMGRPSKLRVEIDDGHPEIDVTGGAVSIPA